MWSISETSNRSQIDSIWPRHYAALLEYCKEHGHCNVPQKERYECELPGLGEDGGPLHYHGQLGRWLANQRRYKKLGSDKLKVHPDREALLQALVDEGVNINRFL